MKTLQTWCIGILNIYLQHGSSSSTLLTACRLMSFPITMPILRKTL